MLYWQRRKLSRGEMRAAFPGLDTREYRNMKRAGRRRRCEYQAAKRVRRVALPTCVPGVRSDSPPRAGDKRVTVAYWSAAEIA